MMTERWHEYAQQVLAGANSPAIADVQAGGVDGAPFSTRVTLAGGAELRIQWVRSSTGKGNDTEVITGPVAAFVKVPPVATGARIQVAEIERHLAALLNNGGSTKEAHGSDEVESVTAFVDDPGLGSDRQPHGLRVVMHSGAQVFGLFVHTLSAGQRPGAPFKQAETV